MVSSWYMLIPVLFPAAAGIAVAAGRSSSAVRKMLVSCSLGINCLLLIPVLLSGELFSGSLLSAVSVSVCDLSGSFLLEMDVPVEDGDAGASVPEDPQAARRRTIVTQSRMLTIFFMIYLQE